MLTPIAKDVWIHQSEFLKSNTTVIKGETGLLIIDPGITTDELSNLVDDITKLNLPVVAGFSTHPHWDHVLWDARLGNVPRYATPIGANSMKELLSGADWKERVAGVLPPDIAHQIPVDDLFGQITSLPEGVSEIPWDGPTIRIIQYEAHEKGHAALFVEESGVLIPGDMLSDTLIPFINLDAAMPIDDYLDALRQLEAVADGVTAFVPGHGSVGDNKQLRERIALDRTYVQALKNGGGADDPRFIMEANKDWLPGVREWQLKQLAGKR